MSNSMVVIGGGLVGAATAYYAAREGFDVTLLEMQRRGYGASGRNPGFVWLHCREKGWGLDVAFAGRALYEELQRDLPVPFEFRADGGLIYFHKEEQGEIFRQFVEARQKDGLDMSLIDGKQVKELVGPIRSDVLGASYCANDAQINTPTVVNALIEGAIAEGAKVLEGVKVERVLMDDSGVAVGVDTDQGRFLADKVVVASGAWTEKILEQNGIKAPIGKERLQVLALAPQPMQVKPLVYGPLYAKHYQLFRDLPAWKDEYFTTEVERETGLDLCTLMSQRANGEILFGCPVDYPSEMEMVTSVVGQRMILQYIESDFPSLATAPIDRMWAGILPFTSDSLPIIDEVSPNLYVAAGHVFGNAAGPITGKMVVQMAMGKETDVDLTPVRFDRHLEPIKVGQGFAYGADVSLHPAPAGS